MNVTSIDKAKALIQLLKLQAYMPGGRRLGFIFRPIDATRYTEFSYLIKYLEKEGHRPSPMEKVLDVSSPHMLAYFFHRMGCHVLKTDINPKERRHISPRERLNFKIEDARRLSFSDNSFDLVYSISVLEHIYCDYLSVVREIIRVTRGGGIIYVTFPVAENFVEEWLTSPIYSDQASKNGKTFFQYRFDEQRVIEIKDTFFSACRILACDIYWERIRGSYDNLVRNLRLCFGSPTSNKIKNSLLHALYGWLLFPGKCEPFSKAGAFGNLHLIAEKK